MEYPLFAEKYKHSSATKPSTIFEETDSIPHAVVLCFQPPVYEYARKSYDGRQLIDNHPRYSLYMLSQVEEEVGVVGNLGIGGPATARVIEELIVRGVEEFVILGHAGCLQRDIDLGDIVVVERALRDEGTSYHYLEPARAVPASTSICTALAESAKANGETVHTGTTWTTDAMFRQTVNEVKQYAADGVLTVDMEAASAFAVSQFRNVETGAVFVISDYVGPEQWDGHLTETWSHLERVFNLVIGTLETNG